MKDFYSFYLKRINSTNKALFLIEALFLILLNVAQVFIPILQKRIIDSISNTLNMKMYMIYLCIVCAFGVILGLSCVVIQCILIMYFERRLQLEMVVAIYNHSNTIIEKRGAGAYLSAIFGDTEHIAQTLSNNVFALISQLLASLIILIYSLRWSKAFFFIVCIAFILLIISNYISSKIYAIQFENGRKKVMELNPKVLETIENSSSILSYSSIHNIGKKLLNDFKLRDSYFLGSSIANGLGSSLDSLIKTIALMMFFIVSVYEIKNGSLAYSTFVALLSCLSYVFLPVSTLKEFFMGIKKYEMMKKRISPGLIKDCSRSIPKNNSLVMKNCSFSYHNNSNNILNTISISVDKKIGLVGLSGEGKSTIVNLLLGELSPTSGSCTIGNTPTSEVYKNLLYSLIRYYKQDSELFDEDLEFNITLGKQPLSTMDYTNKVQECKKALHNLISESIPSFSKRASLGITIIEDIFFPGGFELYPSEIINAFLSTLNNYVDDHINIVANAYVAKHFFVYQKYIDLVNKLSIDKLSGRKLGQRGKMVSGGEKNRILMARFLLPEYSDIYLIDEPMTSLDAINEKECIKLLKQYTQKMSGIIISHKLDLVKELCDEIYVIDNGTLSDKGTHDSLMKTSLLYQKLYTALER